MSRVAQVVACIACMVLAASAGAQEGPGDDLLPVLEAEAPLLSVWYVARDTVPERHSKKIRKHFLLKLIGRHDIRILGQKKQMELLREAPDPALAACDGSIGCLLRLARFLKVDRMIGVVVDTVDGGYRLALTSLIMKPVPRQLNSVAEGSLGDLLEGGIASALQVVFDPSAGYAPVEAGKSGSGETESRKAPPPVERPPVVQERLVASEKPVSRQVEVHRLPVATTTKPADVHAERRSFVARHAGSIACGAVALASAATAIALGVLGQQIADEQSVQYDPARDALGRRYTTAANAMFGVAGAGAAAAVLLFVLLEDEPADSVVAGFDATAGTVVVGGTF